MTMLVQEKANTEDTAVTRADLMHLIQEVGSSEQLDVSGQDLRGIDLMNCNLEGANLSQASVCEANLCGARLSKANLHGADLHGTYLCWADLRGASLSEADLREADLSWASLGGASSFERPRSDLQRKDQRDRCRTFLREGRQIRPWICAWSPLHECGWLPDGGRHKGHTHTDAAE